MSDRAVRCLLKATGHSAGVPLTVHFHHISDMGRWARDIPEAAWYLGAEFWPGPLVMVLKRDLKISDGITGGRDTIRLNIPQHPVAQRLLFDFKGGIATTGALGFGNKCQIERHTRLASIGSKATVGPTLIDFSRGAPEILCQGAIQISSLQSYLDTHSLGFEASTLNGPTNESYRAPQRSLCGDVDCRKDSVDHVEAPLPERVGSGFDFTGNG